MANAYDTAARYMDKEVVNPLRQMLVGRKLFAKVTNLPVGKFNVDYLTMSEMGDAMVSMARPDPSMERDNVNMSLSNVPLHWIAKGYKIERQTYDAFQSEGIPMDTSSMLSAAYVCAKKEDSVLVQGWAPDGTNYEAKGLYQSAGNDYSSSKDFGTYGYATDAIAGALALLWADNVYGVNFNLVLHPTQFAELIASESDGDYEMAHIRTLLNLVPGAPMGDIMVSTDLVAGTGLLSPVDNTGRLMDLVIGQDYENDIGVDSRAPRNSPIYGTLSACLRARIKQANALCKLSQI